MYAERKGKKTVIGASCKARENFRLVPSELESSVQNM